MPISSFVNICFVIFSVVLFFFISTIKKCFMSHAGGNACFPCAPLFTLYLYFILYIYIIYVAH